MGRIYFVFLIQLASLIFLGCERAAFNFDSTQECPHIEGCNSSLETPIGATPDQPQDKVISVPVPEEYEGKTESEVEEAICAKRNILKNGSFEKVNHQQGEYHKFALSDLCHGRWDIYQSLPVNQRSDEISWRSLNDAGIEVQHESSGRAKSGKKYIELDTHKYSGEQTTTLAEISQKVFLIPGEYKLKLFFKTRNRKIQDALFQVLNNQDILYENFEFSSGYWKKKTINILITDYGYYDLTFKGTGRANGIGPLIDAVRLRRRCGP